ncbi:hypothetical protein AXG93_3645s1000 [Marchantia polymorpha subsp. ruderalis]|uniref:Integrase catalytic domain-containing protein n=1 Tax=Marchantia polymorpha subsp. ruderalis TaxID=1480154 RepID=A0A176WKI3_MARPO|nr:hypothetical protein AXG93_3645s1000 [Marchantia polymorpha subsp. ruderalis]
MLLLQEFNYEINVRPGKHHINADYFSRIDGGQDDKEIYDRFPDEELFQIFCRFGPPLELVSDRGKHFLKQKVEEMTTLYRVKHRKTTPYHPKANGLTKRANGIIRKILNKTVAVHKNDWDVKLFVAVYAYNLAYKVTTCHTFGEFELNSLLTIWCLDNIL